MKKSKLNLCAYVGVSSLLFTSIAPLSTTISAQTLSSTTEMSLSFNSDMLNMAKKPEIRTAMENALGFKNSVWNSAKLNLP
ncbi:MAG: hypothetical protein K6T83_06160 [Alicyclobacillus sp.]|nr:hypothetical protein [Alicyclobacillus sp.]